MYNVYSSRSFSPYRIRIIDRRTGSPARGYIATNVLKQAEFSDRCATYVVARRTLLVRYRLVHDASSSPLRAGRNSGSPDLHLSVKSLSGTRIVYSCACASLVESLYKPFRSCCQDRYTSPGGAPIEVTVIGPHKNANLTTVLASPSLLDN